MYKRVKLSVISGVFKRGLRLFKGLCLLFLPNVPGTMFIQGGTFIPDSRVKVFLKYTFLVQNRLQLRLFNLSAKEKVAL